MIMDDPKLLLGKAIKLLQAVDDCLVVDCIRINDIELNPFEAGLVYELREFVKENRQFKQDYERWLFEKQRSTQECLDSVKRKKRRVMESKG